MVCTVNKTFRVSIFVLLSLAILIPSPVFAAVSLLTVTPGLVYNNVTTTIQVEGTQFQAGAVVSLGGYGDLSTTFIGKRDLKAAVPAGIPAGVYTVTVTNPDMTSASLASGLTVSDPVVPTQVPPAERPLMVVKGYKATVSVIHFGEDFSLVVTIRNEGQLMARNVQATFGLGDLIPRTTGGVVAVGDVAAYNKVTFDQPMTAATDLWGKSMASVDMALAYSDSNGTVYSEKFTLVIPLEAPAYFTATPTPNVLEKRPQLVISSYSSSVEPLQPGTQFVLDIGFANVGMANARQVVMILGGGNSSGGTTVEGTPVAGGGISGGGGEFTNFAPIGASNVQSLGDLAAGATFQVKTSLVVNVSTNPGAYPLKISFAYVDENGLSYTDDQVITLLVYSLPNVEISFYRTPDVLMAGQPGILPLQVVNVGRKSAILGSMRVEAVEAFLENNQTLVGILEPGGYFTLDPMLTSTAPGTLELSVTVDYTDDFNQPRSITKTLTVEIMEMPTEGFPPDDGGLPPESLQPTPETFWQKVWRFILGLLGLDSAPPVNEMQPGENVPAPEMPVPMPGGKG